MPKPHRLPVPPGVAAVSCSAIPVLLLALLLGVGPFGQVPCSGQGRDMMRLRDGGKVVIPFTLDNNFIVIKTSMNDRFSLRFIVDTGAENTILLDKEFTDDLDVNYQRKFVVAGADMDRDLIAYLATGIDLQLDEALLARHRTMLVLEENYANLDQVVGTEIHGILGADFLMRFVVEIDYQKQELVLHEPGRYRPKRQFVSVPSSFYRHRPYLNLPISFAEPRPSERKLLLDSGAGITLLLHTIGDTLLSEDLPVPTVPSYLANGIGGQVYGNVGRARSLEIAGRTLEDVITYFQAIDTTGRPYLNGRDGILGNRLLKRFTLVIDYINEKVYMRPLARAVRRKFKFDRSGMSVVAGGPRLRQFHIARIIPGSPAERAGLRVGDRIAGINRTSVAFISLEGLLRRLKKRVGKKVRIKYVREGRYYRTEFRLKELI